MASEYDQVTLWVGHFDSARRFKRYLKETYSEDSEDDTKPISLFARDQGEAFYDHDFIEAEYHKKPLTLKSILGRHSHSEFYAQAALEAASDIASESFNVSLLAWGEEISSPRSASGEGYELKLLGTFRRNPRT